MLFRRVKLEALSSLGTRAEITDNCILLESTHSEVKATCINHLYLKFLSYFVL